ncbi:YqcI/YcgG family protein [Nocardia vaccinii]|uniref:YqcI/YcgG family protein n=1 Tax=Nocardia vaccinii TaxID=1822 RepID=UPI001C3FA9A9|nr:YqcI/YcgG family protein [Nocardia vaccinii]
MLDRNRLFPCIFGVDAVRRGSLRYTFVPADTGVRTLAQALTEYAGVAPSLGKRTSLVAFFEPSAEHHSIADYERLFWEVLQGLHTADTDPWPPDIATDADDPFWEFSFAGMPLFVVANTPAHARRQSRYFEYFAITFQPRFVFDDLTPDSAQGRNARTIIRQRLRAYDEVPPTPLLGNFGDSRNREWTQYFLDDDNRGPGSGRCPFTHEAKEAK